MFAIFLLELLKILAVSTKRYKKCKALPTLPYELSFKNYLAHFLLEEKEAAVVKNFKSGS